MELKKNPNVDLQNKRSIFLMLGVALAMLLVVILFGMSQSKKEIDTMASDAVAVEEEMAEITVQEEKPVEPIKQQTIILSDIIKIVNNDTKIDNDYSIFDVDETTDIKDFKTIVAKKELEVEEDIPVVFADVEPTFQGQGPEAFIKWVGSNLEYPAAARENGVSGKVMIKFVVEKDGSVTGVAVVRGVDKLLDAAAVKRVSASPKWKPAENRGKSVRFTYTIPVNFVFM